MLFSGEKMLKKIFWSMVIFHLLVLALDSGNTSEEGLKDGKLMLLKSETAEFTTTHGKLDNALN
jgi:hypothetical protein